MELDTVRLETVVDPFTLPEAFGIKPLHSSSKSLSFVMTLPSCLCRSSSCTLCSLIVNIRLRFTKFEVPGRPEKSQLMPFQCCLKFDWMCFSRSRALISLGFFYWATGCGLVWEDDFLCSAFAEFCCRESFLEGSKFELFVKWAPYWLQIRLEFKYPEVIKTYFSSFWPSSCWSWSLSTSSDPDCDCWSSS